MPIRNVKKIKSLEISYGCYSKQYEEQMSSSSGGFFSVLARTILLDGGVVCGAAFDGSKGVKHTIIDTIDELHLLKGTKYVQSRIGNVYQEIKLLLEQGKKVLFSGTSCQVAGLKSYLAAEYNNLLTIDLICHGVPSAEVWNRYLGEISQGKEILHVSFRNKENGISKTTMDYYFQDGSIIREDRNDSMYMKGFIQNLYLRPSCFACHFKGMNRYSDFTIGDFWSVNEFYSGFSNEKGTSAVIIHTQKGKKYFEQIEKELNTVHTIPKEIACWNECFWSSAKENPNRKEFFLHWNEEKIHDLVGRLLILPQEKKSISFLSKMKNCLKSIKERIK